MEGKDIFPIMIQIKRRVFRRKILALLFLIVIAILFFGSVREDYKLKRFGEKIASEEIGMNVYLLDLNSLDITKNTVNGTLSLKPGVRFFDFKERTSFYGPLNYKDIPYPVFYHSLIKRFEVLSKSSLSSNFYSRIPPTPINISIKAIGNPETYPFDKYLILGEITCSTYFKEQNKKIFTDSVEDGESLSIKNSMLGLFIRYPTAKEFKEKNMFNNLKNNFALIIERPNYLKVMTIILVIFALGTSIYIGFRSTSDALIIQIIGYIVSLWGIHNIIIYDTRIFMVTSNN